MMKRVVKNVQSHKRMRGREELAGFKKGLTRWRIRKREKET